MFVYQTYWIWTQGKITGSLTLTLDPNRIYLVTGALVAKQGGDAGQVYISTVCRRSGHLVRCGVRDDGLDVEQSVKRLGLTEVLSNSTRVTIKLRGTGGLHRAEGVVYDIT
ncbi:hypothetical protein GCM10012275_09910 [Longimycelium tulufanense]|uniref:Uncharacterized protein n=1 Tax=Longimycelium tulufanense TaxID=907463 RepID=A0A8J3C9U1_9PSEU|nr:hypothetical protein [Longimycelium tulufanense]GGM40952.1 hypothetical protein GCM10012275_09910 [Longimycelium tulufanense]